MTDKSPSIRSSRASSRSTPVELQSFTVEGDVVKALKNCHRRYVMEMGNNRFEGNAKGLLENGEGRRLYLCG